MKNKLVLVLECAVLVASMAVTVATSKKGDNDLTTKSYGMANNCSGTASTNEAIVVTGSSVTSPAGRTFFSYGIPTDTLSIGQASVQGTASGITRTCTYGKMSNSGATMHVYSCVDSNSYSCQVSFTEL